MHARASLIKFPFVAGSSDQRFSLYIIYITVTHHTSARSVSRKIFQHVAICSTWSTRDPFVFLEKRALFHYCCTDNEESEREREKERMREKDRIFVSYALNCINHIATIRLSNCNDRKMGARRIKKRREKERESMRACVSERTSKWENTVCIWCAQLFGDGI